MRQIRWKWGMAGSSTTLTIDFEGLPLRYHLERRAFDSHWEMLIDRPNNDLKHLKFGRAGPRLLKRRMRQYWGEAILRAYAGVD